MYKAATIENWVVIIYEGQRRFRREVANQMIADLVKSCDAVGKAIQASLNAASRTEI
jgi:hypothetical protein